MVSIGTGRRGGLRRRGGIGLALLAVLAVAEAGGLDGLRLVMFDAAHCGYCERWREDIGGVYHKTDEGRRAPLLVVPLDGEHPAGLVLARPVRFTPTFVLARDGVEVGRVTGYSGDFQFWGLLSPLLARIDGETGH